MLSIKEVSVLAFTLAATSAFAGAVSFTSFGTLSAANFGGSGIPNDAVAITEFNGVTLGLTATARFSQPTVTNNGAGVFNAVSGAYAAGDNLARWNFDFYVGGSGIGAYSYRLFADSNPAVGNDDSSYSDISGYLSLPDSLLTAGARQNSGNLGFGTN